jgi:hypothetical protein
MRSEEGQMVAYEVFEERRPVNESRPVLRVVEAPDEGREQAIESGRIEDALIMRRVGTGVLIGILATVVMACAVVAVGLLIAGAFSVGGVLAGVGGGVLGGVYFGAVMGAGGPAEARSAAAERSSSGSQPPRLAA